MTLSNRQTTNRSGWPTNVAMSDRSLFSMRRMRRPASTSMFRVVAERRPVRAAQRSVHWFASRSKSRALRWQCTTPNEMPGGQGHAEGVGHKTQDGSLAHGYEQAVVPGVGALEDTGWRTPHLRRKASGSATTARHLDRPCTQ